MILSKKNKLYGICPVHKHFLDENLDCELCKDSGIKSIRCTIKDIDSTVSSFIREGYTFDPSLSHAILIFEEKINNTNQTNS